ncbi:MAG: exo-alpha-sialidase [Bacteroidetes bacterium]|nr:exo-alpha-sialidase [Bacteroidota bacterium]
MSPFKLFSILLLLIIFISGNVFAQQMKIESVTVHEFKTPVLKGKEVNPIFRIQIETTGKKNPVSLQNIGVEINGTDIQNDIKELSIFYSEDKPFLRDGILFGTPEKPNKLVKISGVQKLAEGTNNFWISFKLKENANILNELSANCLSLIINKKEIKPEIISPPISKKLGIALRKHNDNGVDTYRIPGLATTNNGTLIAVYDIRRNSATDLQEDVDIGINRSTDGGKTWEPMEVIMDMGEWGGLSNIENGIGDPSVLVDRETNTIWVAAVWAHGHPGKRNWFASKQGMEPKETSQFVLVKSEDDGKTWSEPINITSQIKDPKWHLLLQGPGKGITLKDGMLVFPAQFKDENEIPHSTIIYSKNHGKKWEIGTGAKPNTTEAQVIELNDGSLMLNMRDDLNREDKSATNGRSVYITKDLGETWEKHFTSRGALQEPNCMASLIKEEFLIDGKLQNVVLFSNPNSKYRRNHMTIKISFDNAKTWPSEYNLLLDELAGRGYSCMTKIDDKHVGILYEGSQADLTFQIIPIEEIIQQHKELNYIFKSGTDGYSTFRIPAIVTTKSGKLLAFAEGRVKGSSDTGDIDLVMKSSNDQGKTWSNIKVIWNDGDNVCGNPAPVVDTETDEVHLLMTWNLGSDHEHDIISQKSKDTRRVFVSSSSNEGETWTTPKEITSSTKQENWTWYATGPCHGIQLIRGENKNRLVIPCDHIEAGTRKYFSHTIYSDDHGKTWQLGGTTPQDQVNECTIAELPDGKLLLNMRNYDRTQKSRKISWSDDGGLAWSNIQADSALIEPICQASLLFSEENQTMYFLNPASTNSRTKMTLKASKDLGKTWQTEKTLNSGASAYSDITLIKKNMLGCLYEGGVFSPYEGIAFTTINIE